MTHAVDGSIKQNMESEAFCKIWRSAPDLDAVAASTGLNKQYCTILARRLRADGEELEPFQRGRKRKQGTGEERPSQPKRVEPVEDASIERLKVQAAELRGELSLIKGKLGAVMAKIAEKRAREDAVAAETPRIEYRYEDGKLIPIGVRKP